MTAPNLLLSTVATAKTGVLIPTTVVAAIVSNTAGSNKVLKCNALYISNINGSSAGDITVDLYRSTVPYRLAYLMTIPAKTTLDLLSKSIYLEEGDSLRITASANSIFEAVCSYEELS